MQHCRLWRVTALIAAAGGLAGLAAIVPIATVPAAAASRAAVTVTIATKSGLPKVTGDTLVVFAGTKKTSHATVHGTVTGAANGDAVTLLREPFGAAAFKPVTSHKLTTAGGYSFSVDPARRTRYQVQVTGSDITGPPPASKVATVYVTPHAAVTGRHRCSRPVCRIKLKVWVKVPTVAYAAEAGKHWYLYSRLRLAAHREPAPPKELRLNTNATASKPVKLHSYEFVVTLRYKFRIGNHGYRWRVNFCTKDAVNTDGIGLPGHHACGNKWISAARSYLG
jgi:hypothetical protein